MVITKARDEKIYSPLYALLIKHISYVDKNANITDGNNSKPFLTYLVNRLIDPIKDENYQFISDKQLKSQFNEYSEQEIE